MFYSDHILTKKGPLANIWLAAHWDKKLSKAQIVQTNIDTSVRDLLGGSLPPMALRLSGQLLLGVTKIYQRKAKYLLEDCAETMLKLKLSFKPSQQVDLPAGQAKAAFTSITLPAINKNMDDFLGIENDIDLDAILRGANINQNLSRIEDITLKSHALATRLDDLPDLATFGPADENELPVDFNLMDIEVGRRATGEQLARQSDPTSIELGRRASILGSEKDVSFSPLRTPQKLGSANENIENINFFDQGPDLNDILPFDEEMMKNSQMLPFHSPTSASVQQLLQSPVPTVVRTKKVTDRGQVRKKRTVLMDETTELSNSLIQAQLRNASDLLLEEDVLAGREALGEASNGVWDDPFGDSVSNPVDLLTLPSLNPLLNADQFGELFKANKGRNNESSAQIQAQIQTQLAKDHEENYIDHGHVQDDGMLDNWYNDPVQNNEERLVPDTLSVKAESIKSGMITRSPIQRPALEQPSLQASKEIPAATFSRSTVETIEQWQCLFKESKSGWVNFEQLPIAAAIEGTTITRRNVALAFFEILVLQTKSMVQTEQATPYGSIRVRGMEELFSVAPTTTVLMEQAY